MKTRLYKVGEEVTNMVILGVAHESTCAHGIKYLVRFNCCGASKMMDHTRVRQRVRDGSTTCRKCANRTGKRREVTRDDIKHDGWVSPPSMLARR